MANRQINVNTYKQSSLEDYQCEIFRIWPQLEDRPALHTWARVVQHATVACEGMRRSDWSLVLKEMATTIVWWLGFIQKLNLLSKSTDGALDGDFIFALPLTATQLIWRKYPSVCPVEFGLHGSNAHNISWSRRPAQICGCLGRKKDVEQRSHEEKVRAKKHLRSFAKKNVAHCPKSIDTLERMFQPIFIGAVYQLSLQELFFHFIEEIGEVSEALADATTSEYMRAKRFNRSKFIQERQYKISRIAEELADVFSWSVSIVAKVRLLLMSFEKHLESRHEARELQAIRKHLKGSKHISLTESIWQKYGLKQGKFLCDDCCKSPCQCNQQRAKPLYIKAIDKNILPQLISSSRAIILT